VRDLELVVSDGRTFAEREHTATTQQVRLLDPSGLRYQQVNTARSGRYRITKTYTTDPARSALLLDVTFESLDHAAYQVHALFDPALANSGDDDTGSSSGTALLASDPHGVASALLARPAFSGFLGTSDGWTDLERDFRMDFHQRRPAAARAGLGRPAADRRGAALRARHAHLLGHAAGLVARAVRAAGALHPGRSSGRAVRRRRLPLPAHLPRVAAAPLPP
jgi:Glucodextranase, domain N